MLYTLCLSFITGLQTGLSGSSSSLDSSDKELSSSGSYTVAIHGIAAY